MTADNGMSLLLEIKGTQKEHTEKLDAIQTSLQDKLGDISNHTGRMASSLDGISETNGELAKALTGWRQPVMLVVVLVLGIVGIMVVQDQLARGNRTIHIGPGGLDMSQQDPK